MTKNSDLDPERQRVKDEFIEQRGYWSELWDSVLELDPAFLEAFTTLSAVPWNTGTLEPKMKEFIYIAIDASTTHLYEPGLRQHIRNAIGYGATRHEVMEVLQLVSAIGIHACTVGVPILMDEFAASDGMSGDQDVAKTSSSP